MNSPFGRSLGKGGLTLITTLKLLPLVTGRTWLAIYCIDCLFTGLGDGLKFWLELRMDDDGSEMALLCMICY
jgi:hypothetical protein